MTKARDLANIITGGFTADDIPNIPASKITSGSIADARIPNLAASKITSGQFADARIADLAATKLTGSIADARIPASAVSQHATSFDDNAIVNDLSTIALRQATNENAIAYNTNSSFVDVFQDSSGIASNTNAPRDASEYVSSIAETQTTLPIKFMINQNGANNSTTITDAMGNHTITRYGNTKWDTGEYKFGTSSLYFDGNGDYLTMADHTHWWFKNDSNGWTAEMWYKQRNTSGEDGYGRAALFGQSGLSSGGNGNPRQFLYRNGGTVSLWHYAMGATPDGAGNIGENQGLANLEDGNWHHIVQVFEHNGGNGKLGFAIDGTWGTTQADVSTFSPNSSVNTTFNIGRANASNGSASQMSGYVDSFRLTHKNIYTIGSNFTAPTSAFITTETTLATSATGNFIGNTITAPSSTSKMGAIITYQDQAGTNTLNTDIILQLSADNGSNFTTATLTALPNYSTGIKMAKVNDLAVTAGTQLKYKISFANQSGSKEARIRGVSLQY
jgi:hypothetical protein